MDFNRAVSKEGAWAGVWILNSNLGISKTYSYKLNFQCTNNIAEYEALILGLHLLKRSGAKIISIHRDSGFIVNQIKSDFSTKHPRLRAYINVVLDCLQCFQEYQLSLIPKSQNVSTNALDTSASTCKIPFHPIKKYEIEVKHRPPILDNIRYWQLFDNDKQLDNFL